MIRRTAIRSAFAIATTLLLSLTAHAQLFRAYVSSTGSDTNPCTLPAPCRLLPAALAAVANGGEIWMLDSGNYNTATVTIGKSVSILAVPGAVGSVLAIGGPAISITAASLAVALRNLVIVPLPNGGGTVGISMTGASTLTIEDSLIANLTADGVKVVGIGAVRIANTTFRNNAGGYAVFAQNGARVMISGTRMLEISEVSPPEAIPQRQPQRQSPTRSSPAAPTRRPMRLPKPRARARESLLRAARWKETLWRRQRSWRRRLDPRLGRRQYDHPQRLRVVPRWHRFGDRDLR